MSTINRSESEAGSVPGLREWAAALLGIELAADPAQQRRQALAKLDEAEYRPPRAWREAIDALLSPPDEFRWSDWPEYQRDLEDRLSEAVESFAATLLDLPTVERGEGWQTLNARCADFPILRRRLAPLLPAVDIDRENMGLPEGRAQELGQLALRLVKLPRSKRNRLRIAAIESMLSDPVSWEQAAKTVRTSFPKIAALAPELFDEVSRFSTLRETAIATRNVRRMRRQGVRTHDLEESSSDSFLGKYWWILLILLVGLRGCASLYKAVGKDPRHAGTSFQPVLRRTTSAPASGPAPAPPPRIVSQNDLEDSVRRRQEALAKQKKAGRSLSPQEQEFLRQFPEPPEPDAKAPANAEGVTFP